jgi:hypothetical protein
MIALSRKDKNINSPGFLTRGMKGRFLARTPQGFNIERTSGSSILNRMMNGASQGKIIVATMLTTKK